jgi:hypothetical protein
VKHEPIIGPGIGLAHFIYGCSCGWLSDRSSNVDTDDQFALHIALDIKNQRDKSMPAHKFRDNEFLPGETPIYSCTCGFTGPRADVIRHAADNASVEAMDTLLRGQRITALNHELSLAAIAWAKADEIAEIAAAKFDRQDAAWKHGVAELDAEDPAVSELKILRDRASDKYTWACEREHQALERLKLVAKKLTETLEKLP